jgi:hypothetical protein
VISHIFNYSSDVQLQEVEEKALDLQMICFVNPNLVDMGVTGFGMAGRMLRERLIDTLQYTYYVSRLVIWHSMVAVRNECTLTYLLFIRKTASSFVRSSGEPSRVCGPLHIPSGKRMQTLKGDIA